MFQVYLAHYNRYLGFAKPRTYSSHEAAQRDVRGTTYYNPYIHGDVYTVILL